MKVIHHHLPNCAGKSIHFAMNIQLPKLTETSTNKEYSYRRFPFISQFYKNKIKNDPEAFSDSDIVTFVRHPYDRFVSSWNVLMDGSDEAKIPMVDLLRLHLQKFSDLNDFIVNGEEEYFIINKITRIPHFKSQSSFCDNNWEVYKNIYKVENIQEDFKTLVGTYELYTMPEDFVLEKRNESVKLFSTEDLTDESKALIYERHKLDFEHLGYEQ